MYMARLGFKTVVANYTIFEKFRDVMAMKLSRAGYLVKALDRFRIREALKLLSKLTHEFGRSTGLNDTQNAAHRMSISNTRPRTY